MIPPTLDLADKVVLISGAARGQGACEARLFASYGARVVVADVLESDGRAVAGELGATGTFVQLDVGDEAAWDAAVGRALERFGRLDVLINNAGILATGNIETTSLADYERLIRVNQLGVFLGMKAALPALKTRGGAIVNIASGAGLRGTANSFAYGATKWAVRGMGRSAAIEFARYGIRVNTVIPFVIDTEMVAPMMGGPRMQAQLESVPLGRAGRVDEVARLVAFLASDTSSYCTGGEFVIDGGKFA